MQRAVLVENEICASRARLKGEDAQVPGLGAL